MILSLAFKVLSRQVDASFIGGCFRKRGAEYSDIFKYTYSWSIFGGFKILNLSIYFFEKIIFSGYENCVDILGVIAKLDYFGNHFCAF